MVVVGLAGRAGSGKSTAAEAFELLGFERAAFADALRRAVLVTFGQLCPGRVTPQALTDGKNDPFPAPLTFDADAAAVGAAGWVAAVEAGLYPGRPIAECDFTAQQERVDAIAAWLATQTFATPRELLQRMGTEAGRAVWGTTLWCRVFEREHLTGYDAPLALVVDDCRFPEERQLLRQHGGVLVRIYSEADLRGATGDHASETSLGPDADYDVCVINFHGRHDARHEYQRRVVEEVLAVLQERHDDDANG